MRVISLLVTKSLISPITTLLLIGAFLCKEDSSPDILRGSAVSATNCLATFSRLSYEFLTTVLRLPTAVASSMLEELFLNLVSSEPGVRRSAGRPSRSCWRQLLAQTRKFSAFLGSSSALKPKAMFAPPSRGIHLVQLSGSVYLPFLIIFSIYNGLYETLLNVTLL